MRAGIAKFDELPYLDNRGEPIYGAMVPGLEPDLKRGTRLIKMLVSAIKDCLSANPSLQTLKIPLLVGLAEEGRPGGGGRLAESIIERVQSIMGVKFHPTLSQVIPKGHVAGFEAMRLAREFLKDSAISICLVCGVDSYINASSLLWLDNHFRLKTAANQHGLIPGEAAAAILIRRMPAETHGVEVAGLGFGFENAHVLSEEPLLGLGLTKAAQTALTEAGLGYHEIDLRLSDVTGEQYGFKELPLLEGRLARVVRKEAQPIWHCTDSMGDTGAAAGVAQFVVVNEAYGKRYAPGKTVICLGSAVSGDRGAAVIRQRPT
jgi:3-oxoacyl-[acyl-carrier-protein] synthase-1